MARALARLLCLAVLLLAVPRPGHAEGEGGGFWWSPSLRASTVVDDNLFFEDGNGEGSVGFWVIPRVELGYGGAAFEVGADVSVDVRRYLDHSSAMADELYRAVGWAELGLAPGLSLRVANAYVPQAVVLGLPEDDGRNLVQTNRADAELLWGRALGHGRTLSAGVVATSFLTDDYPELVPAGGGFAVDPSFQADYLQGLAFAQVDTPVGESTSLWGRGQASYRDFDEVSSADHGNFSALLGVRSEPWRGVELSLSGGAGALTFAGNGTKLRGLVEARGEQRFDGGLSLWLSAGHLHSPDLSGSEVDQSTGEIGIEQRFGSATAASLRVFVTRYAGGLQSGGANLYGAAELRLRRQLTRRMQVGLTYRYWKNAGAFTPDDFSQNRVNLELGWRL